MTISDVIILICFIGSCSVAGYRIGDAESNLTGVNARMDRLETRINLTDNSVRSQDIQLKYLHQQEKTINMAELTNGTLTELRGAIRSLQETMETMGNEK